jgi:hypothetical protein
VTYSSYDARGHAGRVVDGPNDVTLLYDRGERLYQAKVTNTSTLLAVPPELVRAWSMAPNGSRLGDRHDGKSYAKPQPEVAADDDVDTR